jgi:endoglycosylceramidase
MKSGSSIVAIALLCGLLAACGGSSGGSDSSGSPAVPQLRRDGSFLKDQQNRVVLLHGVNAVWKLKPYAPPDTAEGFTAADADWLQAHGFNAVRLGVLFAGVMPQAGVVDQNYLTMIDRTVQLLASRHIWVLLDFHQDMYNEQFYGEGFPDWAVDSDGVPLPFDAGFPGNYFQPATSITFDNLWNDKDGLWDYYRDAWAAVAAKWATQPYLMGYDLINEPWSGTNFAACIPPLGCAPFDETKLQPFQQHALEGIRQHDPDNIAWFEPLVLISYGAPTYLGAQTPVNDANLGLSWHLYCPTTSVGILNLNNISCAVLDGDVLHVGEGGADRLGASRLITEFGATDLISDLTRSTAEFDQHLLGWQYWAYKNWHDPTTSASSAAQGLFADDADLATVKADKLAVLQRTYPQFTAGTPTALSFDPDSGAFSYAYVPRQADGPTEIYVPVAEHYPKGYSVTVSGAKVASATNASPLILENIDGATSVTVSLAANQ